MYRTLAQISLSEWLGVAGSAAGIAGWLWRTARKLAARIDAVLAAIATNGQQTRALQTQTLALRDQLRAVSAKTERIEREGSVPIREVLEAVRGQVVPNLEAVKREQSRVATELTNGGEHDQQPKP